MRSFKRNRLARLALLGRLVLFVVLSFHLGCAKTDRGTVIRVGHGLPEDHPVHQALLAVQADFEEDGADGLVVRIFPNNQLGSSVDQAQMIAAGQLEVGVISAASLARLVPEMNVVALPFLFRDPAHQKAALAGAPGRRLLGYLEAKNLTAFGYLTAGSRNIMAKTPIRRPEDLAGLRIRVMESNLLVDTLRALGGSPVSMDMSEVYGALQQGVLDGWENNPPTTYFYRMQETGASHFSWTRHLMIPDVVVASAGLRERLSEERFAALEAAFEGAIAKQWEDWDAFARRSVEELTAGGMTFHDVNRDLFRDRVEAVYADAFEQYGPEFRSLVEDFRNYRATGTDEWTGSDAEQGSN